MIVAHHNDLKNSSLNIAGVDLKFDADGLCQDVDPEIAVKLFAMKGYIVTGLPPALQKVAENRKNGILAEANGIRIGDYSRGLPVVIGQAVRGGSAELPYTVPAGRVPADVAGRVAASQPAVAVAPPPIPEPFKIKAGKKNKG